MKNTQFIELLNSIGEARVIHKNNRLNKTKPKHGLHWCKSCDRNIVNSGGKCPVCGKKDKSKHQKP